MGTTYNKNIAKCVMGMMENPVCVETGPDVDFYDEIKNTYVYAYYKKEISPYYEYFMDSRDSLHKYTRFDFSDTRFLGCAAGYLNSVYKLFFLYSSQRDGQCSMLDASVVKMITEDDLCKQDDGTMTVGLRNPLVLETLIAAKSQVDDFNAFYLEKDERDVVGETRETIYREHLSQNIDELFRGLSFVIDGKFYTIDGYDEGGDVFIAVVTGETGGDDEAVSALSLYEKIAGAACEKKRALEMRGQGRDLPLNVFVAGATKLGSMDLLKKMTRPYGINIEEADSGDGSGDRIKPDALREALDRDDVVFVLNCSDIYATIATSGRYDRHVMMRSGRMSGRELDVSDFAFSSRGRRLFEDLYYAVQDLAACQCMCDGRGSRETNGAFFDYLIKSARGYVGGRKRVYVYTCGKVDLGKYLADDDNRMCREMNISGGHTVFEIGNECGIIPSPEKTKCFSMTYFDILSAISSSYGFYCKMTDVETEDACDEDVIEAVARAHDTEIRIAYDAVTGDEPGRIDLKVDVFFNHGKASTRYVSIVETVVREMFAVCNTTSPEDGGIGISSSLSRYHKTAMGGVLRERAQNFNDMLFHHLYAGCGVTVDGLQFDVAEFSFVCAEVEHDEDEREKAGFRVLRASKYVAEYLMNNLDGRYYRESCLVDQLRLVGSSRPKLDRYANGLMRACQNLGYTGSMLDARLKKYF